MTNISKILAHFGPVTETQIENAEYALHHKNPLRSWSIFIKDIMLTSIHFHGAYPKRGSPGYVSVAATDILLQGMEALIKQGIDKRKAGVAPTDLVTENDIIAMFGNYELSDDRKVLGRDAQGNLIGWWAEGSSTKVKATGSFSHRLKLFNERIAYLADNGQDYEKLVTYLYPKLGPNWILQGKSQIDVYLFMSRHPAARTQLPLYFDIDDRDYINDKWGTWINL